MFKEKYITMIFYCMPYRFSPQHTENDICYTNYFTLTVDVNAAVNDVKPTINSILWPNGVNLEETLYAGMAESNCTASLEVCKFLS